MVGVTQSFNEGFTVGVTFILGASSLSECDARGEKGVGMEICFGNECFSRRNGSVVNLVSKR